MTLEAKIDRTNELLAQLVNALIPHPSAPSTTDAAKKTKAGMQAVSAPVEETKSDKVETPKKAAKSKAEPPIIEDSTIDDAKSALVELMKTKGKEAGVLVLQSLGVSKLTELKASQYDAFICGCKEAMEQ
jgi:hypothetical protein